MKNLLTISDISTTGVNYDIEPWKLPIGALTQVNNIRFENDHATPHGGRRHVIDAAGAEYLISYNEAAGGGYTAFITVDPTTETVTSTAVGLPSTNITGAVTGLGSILSHVRMGSTLIFHSGVPYYTKDSTTPFVELPWDATRTWRDVNVTAENIGAHSNYLFAWGLTEGGATLDDRVRWSSTADTNGIPDTWDETDIENVAGWVPLGGQGGKIVAGESLRDSFIIYRNRGTHAFDYVGGTYVWKIRQISDKIGAVGRNAVLSLNGIHYIISNGDIYMFDGRTFTSIVTGRVKEYFLQVFASKNASSSYIVPNTYRDEIYFCIKEEGYEAANVAFVFNYALNSWSVIRFQSNMPDGSKVGGCYSHIVRGQVVNDIATWEDLKPAVPPPPNPKDTITWDNIDERWESPEDMPVAEQGLIGLDRVAGQLYLISGHAFKVGALEEQDCVLERVGIVPKTIDEVTSMTKAYVQFSGTGTVVMEFGDQEFPNAPIRWRERKQIDVETQRKVDFRSTGRLHAYRITGSTKDNWRFTGMTIEYTEAGLR